MFSVIYISGLDAFVLLLSLYMLSIAMVHSVRIPVPSQVRFCLRELQNEAAVSSPAPESMAAMTLPQPIIRHTGDVNSDLLQITGGLLQGHTSIRSKM